MVAFVCHSLMIVMIREMIGWVSKTDGDERNGRQKGREIGEGGKNELRKICKSL